jgi:glycosyltransferase involved in cell wall biosynthesis
MNILCVIDHLGSGGGQRQIVELALAFKEKGHNVTFLTYYDIRFYDPMLQEEGISLTCIPEKSYLKRIFKIRKFIRGGKYDAVLSFLEGPSFMCEVAGLPFRNWNLVISEASANPNIFRSPRHIIYRMFHVFTDYVHANSHANMKIVRTINPFLRKSKCKVIYNMIDFEKWKPLQNYVPRKDGKLKMVIAARHQYLKNLNGLIEALSLLTREELDKISVHWYGDSLSEPYVDNSIEEARQKITDRKLEGTISLYPAIHPIINKIQEADVIGLFSFYEGFPNVVCEGMACAKPIVCTAVSDLPNILSYDKNLLCDPSDPMTIKDALSYLISLSDDQLIQIGHKNEKIAKDTFDKEKNLSAYLQLLGI